MKKVNKNLKEAIFCFNRKSYDEARILFHVVLDKDPVNPEANYYLGLMYSKEENYQKGVLHLKAVVDLGTNFIYTQQCRMLLGYIFFKNKDFNRALYEYEEVLKVDTSLVQVYAALSAIHYNLGDKDLSLKYAEKAYGMDEFNINAKNTYAYLLSDYEINVHKSIEMLREVIRLKPDNPNYLDSLGWAYYKKGDIKSSISSYKRSFELTTDIEEIKDHYNTVIGRKKVGGR